MPPAPTPPAPTPNAFGSYGVWNNAIEAAFPGLADCTAQCADLIPAAPSTFVSPFGADAAFDPTMDQWAATWTGPMEGYFHIDPDNDGPIDNRWTGTAKLQIEARAPSTVRLWGENMRYDLEEGGSSGVGVSGVPDSRSGAWSATLSTEAGEKGYFSFSDDQGREIHGQFEAAAPGTTPSRVVGHFQRAGHRATFEASRP